jgi:catechol 2,3-dioxygenase-like lactoylglutathione lyase family enzyme
MPVEGISHITLIVEDIERTKKLLETVLDAQEVYASGERTFSVAREKFFLVAGIWIVIMDGSSPVERSYNHIAFKVQEAELPLYKKRLTQADVEFTEGRQRVDGEGLSLYFYDYDNHLFELHTGTLEERLKTYGRSKGDDQI